MDSSRRLEPKLSRPHARWRCSCAASSSTCNASRSATHSAAGITPPSSTASIASPPKTPPTPIFRLVWKTCAPHWRDCGKNVCLHSQCGYHHGGCDLPTLNVEIAPFSHTSQQFGITSISTYQSMTSSSSHGIPQPLLRLLASKFL